jgi:SAM-dependent methyltransferase
MDKTWNLLQPLVQMLGRVVKPVDTYLDVGSRECFIASRATKTLNAARAVFIDITPCKTITLLPNAVFYVMDVCGLDFVKKFKDRVSVVTCILAFHEFKDQVKAAHHLFDILPPNGAALIFDRSEEGWAQEAAMTAAEGPESHAHHQEDLRRMGCWGLHTNQGIQTFWERYIFPTLPGRGGFVLNGLCYSVLYIAPP